VDVALLAVGGMVQNALAAADELGSEGIRCEVVNARFIKPLDEALLVSLARRFTRLVTIEDNSVVGGFGSGVAEFYSSRGMSDLRVRIHGLPDRFVDHGSPEQLHKDLSLDAAGIARVVREWIAVGPSARVQPAGITLS